MIRALLISVSSIALATAAFAADLPNTKGPAPFLPPPPPVFSWTGVYVGVNAGGSLGDFEASAGGAGVGIGIGAPGPVGTALLSTRSSGFSGGGQIGFNYQFAGNIVVGAEADFQGSTLRGTYLNVSEGGLNEQVGSKVDWWGTARARVGYAFGTILPYVTGGFAYGHESTFFNASEPGIGSIGESFGNTHGGWTAGAGVEYALLHNVSVKVEYLYTDLGTSSVSAFGGAGPAFGTLDTRTRFSTVRAGLNYKFDWLAPALPVVAKY